MLLKTGGVGSFPKSSTGYPILLLRPGPPLLPAPLPARLSHNVQPLTYPARLQSGHPAENVGFLKRVLELLSLQLLPTKVLLFGRALHLIMMLLLGTMTLLRRLVLICLVLLLNLMHFAAWCSSSRKVL